MRPEPDLSADKQDLEFTTRHERPTIKIDGVAYPLTYPEDLQMRDALWIEKQAPRIDRLASRLRDAEDYDESVAVELGALVIRFSDIIMSAVPAEVRERLGDMQKLAVILRYMQLMEARKGEIPFAGAGAGQMPSPGSDDSTAMGPKPGAA